MVLSVLPGQLLTVKNTVGLCEYENHTAGIMAIWISYLMEYWPTGLTDLVNYFGVFLIQQIFDNSVNVTTM